MAPWWAQPPVLEAHGRFTVVREDLVPGGSKVRFLPGLAAGAGELVFGSPFCGGAQVALATWGAREGTVITIFTAKRKELHLRQRQARQLGARIVMVPYGYMSHVQAKARAYAASCGARMLPLGFDLPVVGSALTAHARGVAAAAGPVDEVWCATGSGLLARCLGHAFPDASVFGVVVGLRSRNGAQALPANVELLDAPYRFEQAGRAKAPFPIDDNYERKAWELCQARSRGRVLFWNVLGPSLAQ